MTEWPSRVRIDQELEELRDCEEVETRIAETGMN